MAIGRSSSSRSRTEKTTSWLATSTLVGLLKSPENVPWVYFLSRSAKSVAPSMPSSTSCRSCIIGGSILVRSDSEVMSFLAYVSKSARGPLEFNRVALAGAGGGEYHRVGVLEREAVEENQAVVMPVDAVEHTVVRGEL